MQQRVYNCGKAQLTIDQHSHDQCVGHGEGAGFGRGKDAETDADDQPDREKDGPEAGLDGGDHLGKRRRPRADRLVVAAPGDQARRQHQRDGQQDTGHDAGNEQPTDGNFTQESVKDQTQAGEWSP